MTDRVSGDGVMRWSTLGFIFALGVPLLGTAAGIGTLYAKVDALSENGKEMAERSRRMDEAVNSLNVSVAKLSGAVEALTRRLPDSRGGQ